MRKLYGNNKQRMQVLKCTVLKKLYKLVDCCCCVFVIEMTHSCIAKIKIQMEDSIEH